jgi:hypothetical protein
MNENVLPQIEFTTKVICLYLSQYISSAAWLGDARIKLVPSQHKEPVCTFLGEHLLCNTDYLSMFGKAQSW